MVAVYTREQGVIRGVARHAMRSRKRFGGALEPMTHVRAAWTERPKQDVVRLDRFEILWSPLRDPVDYRRATGLAFLAEILESALPDRAPEDDIFRLSLVAATAVRSDTLLPVTYFALWVTRLLGWMPDLYTCSATGVSVRGETVYYSPLHDGVTCARARPSGSLPLTAEVVAAAHRIFQQSLPALLGGNPSEAPLQPLRRFAVSTLERHLEERLRSARALAAI